LAYEGATCEELLDNLMTPSYHCLLPTPDFQLRLPDPNRPPTGSRPGLLNLLTLRLVYRSLIVDNSLLNPSMDDPLDQLFSSTPNSPLRVPDPPNDPASTSIQSCRSNSFSDNNTSQAVLAPPQTPKPPQTALELAWMPALKGAAVAIWFARCTLPGPATPREGAAG
jgi:hypothetical protein